MASQLPRLERLSAADDVIDNNSEYTSEKKSSAAVKNNIDKQVNALHQKYLQSSQCRL